jgi:hypothetical protein
MMLKTEYSMTVASLKQEGSSTIAQHLALFKKRQAHLLQNRIQTHLLHNKKTNTSSYLLVFFSENRYFFWKQQVEDQPIFYNTRGFKISK